MKVSMSSRGLQDFFTRHVEKMVFGVMVVAVGWGLYAFATHETFEKTPEQLKAEADAARAYVLGSTWDAAREEIATKDPTQAVSSEKELVKVDPYVLTTPIKPVPNAIKAARTQPTLLAALEPEAHAGFGPIAFAGEGERGAGQRPGGAGPGGAVPGGAAPGGAAPGGAAPGGVPGGAVPGAAVPGGAAPGGAGPGGAAPGGAAAGAKRSQSRRGGVNLPANAVVQGKHFAVVTAVAPFLKQDSEYYMTFRDCRFTDPVKDRPRFLGMRIERAEVKSDDPNEPLEFKDIRADKALKETEKWAAFAPEVVNAAAIDDFLTFPLPLLVDGEWGRNVAHARLPALNAEAPEEDEVPLDEEAPADEADGEDDDPFARRAADGGGRRPSGGVRPAAGGNAGANRNRAATNTASDKLVRFFDFNVAPGKRYRYRVQLVLANPNYGVPTRHVSDVALTESNYIEAPWSEPTPIVTIPRGTSLLAGGARPATGANEPAAEVMLVQQSKKHGVNLLQVFKMMRGQLADFPKQDLVFTPPDNPENPEELTDVDMISQSVLLDLRGGEPLPDPSRRLRDSEPAELLILDPDGRLVVRSELSDGPDFSEKKKRLDEWNKILKPGKEEEEEEDTGNSFIDQFAAPPGGAAPGGAPGIPGGNRKPR